MVFPVISFTYSKVFLMSFVVKNPDPIKGHVCCGFDGQLTLIKSSHGCLFD